MTQELADKIAIVTGASKGLGQGMAELFVREGARVVIGDIDETRGARIAEEFGKAVRFKRVDVSKRNEVQALVDFAIAEFGGLHILVNNAGVSDNALGPLLDDGLDRFERVMQVNVLGTMYGTQCAARYMAKHGGGSIVNISSIGGLVSGHGFPIYRASKSAVISFTQTAAIELGEHLIRVNCICPGNIPTEMGAFAAAGPGMSHSDIERMQAEIRDIRMKRQPLKRRASPLDVAQAVLFLGSDRAQQITGQVISVDGGATAGDAQNLIQEIMDVRATVRGR